MNTIIMQKKQTQLACMRADGQTVRLKPSAGTHANEQFFFKLH